ncbi:MAG TPA: hypothetical protein VFE44_02965 [Thermoanaerobaculia bacterium]|nr:hypothetical protein [Thermoanaerobaculia bacterium]
MALPALQPAAFDVERLRAALPAPLAARITRGRELVRGRATAPRETFPTSFIALDRLLDGGLERGALTELVGGRSSGRFSLALATLAAATAAGEAAVLVDLGGHLDPQAARAAGADLERLLWVRPERLRDALVAAETVLGAGFPLVVVDLGYPPVPGGRGPDAAWLRLRRAAESQRAALLVSAPYRVSGTAAAAVVRARARRAAWRGRGDAPRLLAATEAELRLERSRARPDAAAAGPEAALVLRSSGWPAA